MLSLVPRGRTIVGFLAALDLLVIVWLALPFIPHAPAHSSGYDCFSGYRWRTVAPRDRSAGIPSQINNPSARGDGYSVELVGDEYPDDPRFADLHVRFRIAGP